MAKINIKLVKSPIGKPNNHKGTVKALGFTKVGQIVEQNDTPEIRGMINKISHMVEVIE